MNILDQSVVNLIEVAKEICVGDPIQFPRGIDVDAAYAIVATGLLEEYSKNDSSISEILLLATTLHLVMENMSLNHRLMELE